MSKGPYSIITKGRETQVVLTESLPGYRGWKVKERGVARPRDGAHRIDGRWRFDKTAQRRVAEDAEGRRLSRGDLLRMIRDLEARVAKLEGRDAAD